MILLFIFELCNLKKARSTRLLAWSVKLFNQPRQETFLRQKALIQKNMDRTAQLSQVKSSQRGLTKLKTEIIAMLARMVENSSAATTAQGLSTWRDACRDTARSMASSTRTQPNAQMMSGSVQDADPWLKNVILILRRNATRLS